MNIEEIKKFIKENLVIDVDPECQHSDSNNVDVGLRFDDEDVCFTRATICIPDDI